VPLENSKRVEIIGVGPYALTAQSDIRLVPDTTVRAFICAEKPSISPVGKHRAPSPAWCSTTIGKEAASAEYRRTLPVGLAFPRMERSAVVASHRQTGDSGCMAPQGVSVFWTWKI
jgi:hypothetical protein